MLENVAIAMQCNLRQPDAAQSLSALISSPVPSLNLLMLSVAVLERFTAYTLRYAVTLNFDPRDLYLWPLTLNVCSVPDAPWSNSAPNLREIGQSAAELLQFE